MATVVLGASQGLGECLCETFVKYGSHVVGASRNQERLFHLEERLPGLKTFPCDVRSEVHMKNLMEFTVRAFGGISTLILCFGVNFDEYLGEWENTEHFKTVIEINLIGAANAMHAALPFLLKNSGQAQVVVLTSLAGVLGNVPGGSAYAASKAGLDAMFSSLALELKDVGIHVLIVDPGSMEASRDSPRQVIGSGNRYMRNRRKKTAQSPVQVAERIFLAVRQRKQTRMWSTYRVAIFLALGAKLFVPSLFNYFALRVRQSADSNRTEEDCAV